MSPTSSLSISCIIAIIITSIVIQKSWAFGTGGPSYSCKNLRPGHNGGPRDGQSPYTLTASPQQVQLGSSTTGTISSLDGMPFEGFLCSVSRLEDPLNNTVGTMATNNPMIQTITCLKSGENTGITHASKDPKTEAVFTWTPPQDAMAGDRYKLRCVVVQNFFNFWNDFQVDLTIVGQGPSMPTSGSTNINGGFTGNSNPTTRRMVPTTGGFTPSTSTGVIIDLNNSNNNNNGGRPIVDVSGQGSVVGPTMGPGSLPNGQQFPLDNLGLPRTDLFSLDPFTNENVGNSVQFPDPFGDPFNTVEPIDHNLNRLLNINENQQLGGQTPNDLSGPLDGRFNRLGNPGGNDQIFGGNDLNIVQTGNGNENGFIGSNLFGGPGPVVSPPPRGGMGVRLNNEQGQNNARRNNRPNFTTTRGGFTASSTSTRAPRRNANISSRNGGVARNVLRSDPLDTLMDMPRSQLINLILRNSRIRFPTFNDNFFLPQTNNNF